MRHRGEEWISIGDLMAGVVAVVVLLFVIAAVEGAEHTFRRAEAHARFETTLHAMEAARAQGVETMLLDLARDVASHGMGGEVAVDVVHHRVVLADATFLLGSACVTPRAEQALAQYAARFRRYLQDSPEWEMEIEGHTDDRRVSRRRRVRGGFRERGQCALFDDNYTLSAARAREARNVILGISESRRASDWPDAVQRRVTVAGFGSSRPRQGRDPGSPENRRVELFFHERVGSNGISSRTAEQ